MIELRTFRVCVKCGLTGPDMIGDPPRCSLSAHCGVGQPGRPDTFGGPIWVGRPPQVPTLDAEDHAAILRAIVARRDRLAAMRSCNQHLDCDRADALVIATGGLFAMHCYQPECLPMCLKPEICE